VEFSYGIMDDQRAEPCCACNEYTQKHLLTPNGSYYLCQSCMDKLASECEVGQ